MRITPNSEIGQNNYEFLGQIMTLIKLDQIFRGKIQFI